MVCAPLVTVRLSQLNAYGAAVSSGPFAVPSTKNWTPVTPTLSAASAETATMSLTPALFAGAVMATVGGVVSPGAESALKASMCITQEAPPCVAVALLAPAVLTNLSSVRLPKLVRRVVNPAPAALTVPVDAPAPKIRSDAFVVVAVPLLMALVEPTAAAETSSGADLSSPEYS